MIDWFSLVEKELYEASNESKLQHSDQVWSFQAGCCFEFEFGLQICTGTLVPSISVFVLIKLCTCCSRAAGGSFSITVTLLATKAVISPPIQQHWRDYLSIFKSTADWKSLCCTKQSWPREPHATLFPIIIHLSLEKRWNSAPHLFTLFVIPYKHGIKLLLNEFLYS